MAIFNSFLYVYQRVSPVKNMFFWDFLGFSHDSLTIVWPSNSWGPGHAGHSGSEGESPLADLGDSPWDQLSGYIDINYGLILCYNIIYNVYIYIFIYIYTFLYDLINFRISRRWGLQEVTPRMAPGQKRGSRASLHRRLSVSQWCHSGWSVGAVGHQSEILFQYLPKTRMIPLFGIQWEIWPLILGICFFLRQNQWYCWILLVKHG